MKTSYVVAAFSWMMLLIVPALAVAEEGGWSMPNLNPFAKKGRSRASASVSDAPTSGWKWPKLWPSSAPKMPGMSRSARSSEPSTWQKMTTGTKNAMSKTADMLNPFDNADDNKQAPITGSNSVFSQASKNKKSKAKSFLPSWSWGGEEEKDETVNQFLARPKPDF